MVLKKAAPLELITIYKNYKKDFPENEQKPWWLLWNNIYRRRNSQALVLKERGEILAYTITLKGGRDNCILVDYLAVLEKHRSGGYGSKLLTLLREYYAQEAGIIIEIEELGKGDTPEQNIQRERRKRFYERNGFVMQPVHLELFGVEMHMLYLPIQKAEIPRFARAVEDLYRDALGDKLVDENIKIREIQE